MAITFTRANGNSGVDITNILVGLSTDEKPSGNVFVPGIGEVKIQNGDTFREMDTKTWYMYDADGNTWWPQ